jgi:hypothetical protein
MALIAIAADKGSPGVTTAAIALATVWPRPVLLAECDPAGGDLAYRLPAAGGGRLDAQRGLLSLAVAVRRGLSPDHVWEHTQRLNGGLPVLTGVTTAEQGAGIDALWGRVGGVLSQLQETDVIADCGRIGADGPFYDLLTQAASVILVMRATLGEVVRLRERVAAVAAAGKKRNIGGPLLGVIAVVGQRDYSGTLAELSRALDQGKTAAKLIGGLAFEPKSAEALAGHAGGNITKSLLIRSARDIAMRLVEQLPVVAPPAAELAPAAVPGRTHPAQIEAPAYRQSWPPPGSESDGAARDPVGLVARSAAQLRSDDQRRPGQQRRQQPGHQPGQQPGQQQLPPRGGRR